jgi:hypothetical protein
MVLPEFPALATVRGYGSIHVIFLLWRQAVTYILSYLVLGSSYDIVASYRTHFLQAVSNTLSYKAFYKPLHL